MITWGTKQHHRGSMHGNSKERCRVCKQESVHEYHLFQNYFTLFFMPFFPTGKEIKAVCGDCKKIRTVKRTQSSDTVDAGVVDELMEKRYGKLRYYVGPIVLGALAITLILLIFQCRVKKMRVSFFAQKKSVTFALPLKKWGDILARSSRG